MFTADVDGCCQFVVLMTTTLCSMTCISSHLTGSVSSTLLRNPIGEWKPTLDKVLVSLPSVACRGAVGPNPGTMKAAVDRVNQNKIATDLIVRN